MPSEIDDPVRSIGALRTIGAIGPIRPGQSIHPVRILLVADTHIGFDLPRHPRIERRRRGDDFAANFERALRPALERSVDLVVHGGDLLFRSRVSATLVESALMPLVRVAEVGVPVFLVPGNHERSTIPPTLSTAHPGLHIFREPRTFVVTVRGTTVAIAGFAYARDVRDSFGACVAATGWTSVPADVRVLCMHQVVEGAQVGPGDFTFRGGADVIPARAVPAGFAVVLSGHIHRSQLLARDLAGRAMASPVVYPGSVERTSFAEAAEAKHYALVDVIADPGSDDCRAGADAGRLVGVTFEPLPARPMVTIDVDDREAGSAGFEVAFRTRLAALPADAVVRVRVSRAGMAAAGDRLAAARLRAMAPATTNISVGWRDLGSVEGGRS